MVPQQVFSLKDNDDSAHKFRDSLMCSLASLKISFCKQVKCLHLWQQIHALKSASQPKDLSKKARIKICKVGNTHFVPTRLKSSGVVRYQKKNENESEALKEESWQLLSFIKRY